MDLTRQALAIHRKDQLVDNYTQGEDNMKYVIYNDDKQIVGYFDSDIDGQLPTNSLLVNEQQWLEVLNNQKKYLVDNGKLIANPSYSLPVVEIPQNWQGLTNALRGTPWFNTVYAVAEGGDPTIQTPLSLLIATLNSAIPNFNDLQFALTRLKNNMGNRLSQEDTAGINQVLENNGFSIEL